MYMLNNRNNVTPNRSNYNNINNVKQPALSRSIPTPHPAPRQIPQGPSITLDAVSQAANQVKVKWGEPTWFLFHTLAEKVKEETFQYIRKDLIANIISICHNLPCPTCAKHATEFMNKVNFNTIQTKDDLKKLLFSFHNEVNKRKGYAQFEFDKLDEKYEKAKTVNIIHHFIMHYNVKDFNVNMITANMQRNLIIVKLKEWFKENIKYFDT